MADKNKKILLVDDEEETLMMLSFHLQRAGYQVFLAESGPEALEKTRQEKPDLVVLDRMMPEMDGLELCRRLRQSHSSLYIIMLTAMSGEDDRIAGLEAGADDYLVKPFNPKELVLRVQAIFRRARFDDVPTTPNPKAPIPAATPVVSVPPAQKATTAPTRSAIPVSTPPSEAKGTSAPVPAPARPLRTAQAAPDGSVQATIARNLQATLQEASRAAQSQEISRARELYQQVLKLDATNENALMWLAWYTNDPYEGCNYLEKLVEAHPDNAKAREFLEAGRRRLQELNQLISDSSVLSYWNVAEQMHQDRLRKGVDRRNIPVLPVGQLLLRKGYITHEQLDTAVNLHEMFNRLGTPKKLGEVLLEYGYLTKEQLESVLSEQRAEYNSQFY